MSLSSCSSRGSTVVPPPPIHAALGSPTPTPWTPVSATLCGAAGAVVSAPPANAARRGSPTMVSRCKAKQHLPAVLVFNAEACRPVCEQSLPAELIRNGFLAYSRPRNIMFLCCLPQDECTIEGTHCLILFRLLWSRRECLHLLGASAKDWRCPRVACDLVCKFCCLWPAWWGSSGIRVGVSHPRGPAVTSACHLGCLLPRGSSADSCKASVQVKSF